MDHTGIFLENKETYRQAALHERERHAEVVGANEGFDDVGVVREGVFEGDHFLKKRKKRKVGGEYESIWFFSQGIIKYSITKGQGEIKRAQESGEEKSFAKCHVMHIWGFTSKQGFRNSQEKYTCGVRLIFPRFHCWRRVTQGNHGFIPRQLV